jgi:hypothetical protein
MVRWFEFLGSRSRCSYQLRACSARSGPDRGRKRELQPRVDVRLLGARVRGDDAMQFRARG